MTLIPAAYIRNDDSTRLPTFSRMRVPYRRLIPSRADRRRSFTRQWTHTVSTKLVNELRFSYTNIDFSFSPARVVHSSGPLANSDLLSTPTSTIGRCPLISGIDTGYPRGRAHKTSQVQEALTYSLGRHTIQGGADITFVNVKDAIPFNSRGSIQYKVGGGFLDLTAFGSIPPG